MKIDLFFHYNIHHYTWKGYQRTNFSLVVPSIVSILNGNSAMKKRRITHGAKNFIGYFPSIKKKRMICYESLLERDLIYLLDFEADVIDFEEQPFAIPFNQHGHPHRYTPDFLIFKLDGKYLVEVKPARFVNTPENTTIFSTAMDFCTERGWRFQVLTENEIRMGNRLRNVKLLTQFARHPEHPQLEAAIMSAICSSPTDISIGTILEMVDGYKRNSVIATILKLAFFHKLKLPLDNAPITLSSPISLTSWNDTLSGSSIVGSVVGGEA